MAAELLVGTTNEYTQNCVNNVVYAVRVQAIASGNGATEFRVFSQSSELVKVGVRADNAGEPGTLMGYNNTAQAVVAGWNSLSVSGNNIVSGSYYWLLIVCQFGLAMREVTGGTSRYKAIADYATYEFPTDPETWDASASHLFSIGLWGEAGGIIPQAYYYMNQRG
jgi:hypothetical protein